MAKRLIPNDLLVAFRQTGPLVEALRDLGIASKKAERLIAAFPEGRGLSEASESSLRHLGLTAAQAKRVHAAFRVVALCDETCNANLHKTSRIGDPDKVVRFLRQAIGRKQQEWFAVILLDARQRVIDILGVSIGTLASVDVHPREVFREAVRRAAHSILIAHNHPSGDAEPSDSDVHLTHRMSEVGKLVGIPVLDHLILTPTGSVSLAAMGLVPNPGPKRHPTRRKAKKPVSRSTFSRLMRI